MTQRPQFGKWVESQGRRLREKAEIGPFDRLDPLHLACKMRIQVVSMSAFANAANGFAESVLSAHCECWDAGTLEFPGGEVLVVFNPKRDERRRSATLMEELAHIHLGHKKSTFMEIGGIVLRSWNNSNEKQAYSVGAAALLPEYLLKGARTRGYCKTEVAERHFVSAELVSYRENVTGIRLPNGAVVTV